MAEVNGDTSTALAGMSDSQEPMETPQGTGAPGTAPPAMPSPIDALAGDVAGNAKALSNANPTPQKPGGWARAILGGVQNALAGIHNSPGGLFYEASEGARQQQAIQRQQKQQTFENQQKQQTMSREEAIARATIAHENAATAHDQMLNANLSYDSRQRNIANGKTGIQPYMDAGAQVLQEGLNSDDAQELIRTKKLDPTQVHAFATGEQPVYDASGKEQTDAAGNPIMRPTYTVVGDVPEVTLDANAAKFIADNTNYKFPEGTKMSGIVYGTISQQAASSATAKAAAEETLAEAGIKAENIKITANAQKMLPDWNTALAKTGNDPFKALQHMQSDPRMAQKYPDAATLVQSLYGGPKNWQDLKDKQVEEQQKAQELAQKQKAAATDFTGDPNAIDPVAFRNSLDPEARGVVDMIGQGRAPLNNPGYLLARKPEVMNAVERAYPGFDGSKVTSYQKTYQDFTSGDVAKQLTAGATALEHLNELSELNTLSSRIPTTQASQAYQSKVDTVAAELARFYGTTTEEGVNTLKRTLDPKIPWTSRKAAIETQAKSMGDRLDNLEQTWKNAAPSKAYEAPMPVISDAAKKARATLDPGYAQRLAQESAIVHVPGGKASGLTDGQTGTGSDGKKYIVRGGVWQPAQ